MKLYNTLATTYDAKWITVQAAVKTVYDGSASNNYLQIKWLSQASNFGQALESTHIEFISL